MSNLMQYSNLNNMLRTYPNALSSILSIYERLRYDERINDEPLFWLQYAIAMAEDNNLPTAQEFIETAYARAAARDGFLTFQIDTQAFRILIRIETEAVPGAPINNFEKIIEKTELLNSMINEESHRAFAVKVLENLHSFIARRRKDLSVDQQNKLVYWLATLSATLGQLPADFRARSGSDLTRGIIESARQLLLSGSKN